ncbi:hypothetical protein FGO68_gene5908 [Halteria grandinella]|uniref:Uncharacterized protein n=1 Tax=Halteria grandinella TaxID=5974 RepID=A0A8J8NNR8_HALGN|nr:hypothetical protein FGO68_gene5908 [Halteria grandinella]
MGLANNFCFDETHFKDELIQYSIYCECSNWHYQSNSLIGDTFKKKPCRHNCQVSSLYKQGCQICFHAKSDKKQQLKKRRYRQDAEVQNFIYVIQIVEICGE